jgi:hypothetical protein
MGSLSLAVAKRGLFDDIEKGLQLQAWLLDGGKLIQTLLVQKRML